MKTGTATPSTPPPVASEQKRESLAPWVILAVWFMWLAALVAMSVPVWGKSKRDLLETNERVPKRFQLPQ